MFWLPAVTLPPAKVPRNTFSLPDVRFPPAQVPRARLVRVGIDGPAREHRAVEIQEIEAAAVDAT